MTQRLPNHGERLWDTILNGYLLVGHTTDGTPRTGLFNVKDPTYGATGDGATDDTVAIQAAATACAATGGIVFFPPGTYLVSNAIWIASGTWAMGSGKLATIIRRKTNSFAAASDANLLSRNAVFAAGSAPATIYSDNARGSNLTISNLTVDGNKANQTYSGVTNFNYAGAPGFGCRYIDHVEVFGCRFLNTSQDGIFYAACGKTSTHHNDFEGCGSSDSAFNTLSKNGCSHNGNTSTDAPYTYAFNCSNNYFTGCQDESIQYGWVHDVIIHGNHIYNSGLKGIEGDHSSVGTTMGNAIITDNFVTTTGEEGIGISNADNQKVTITGNQITGTTANGINVEQGSESTYVIANNIVETVAGGYAGGATVYNAIVATGQKVSISGNKIYDCSNHGIAVIAARNLDISANTIEKVLGRAIDINMSSATTVDNILIRGNICDTVDATAVIYTSVNGTVLNCLVSQNVGYNLGNSGASAGTTNFIRFDGSSTVIRYLSVTGNIASDRRGTLVLNQILDLTGMSSVTYFLADGNLHSGNGHGYGGGSAVSTLAAVGTTNIWDVIAGTRTTTISYFVQAYDSIVLSNGTSLTMTLPTPVTASRGRVYTVRNIHASSACTVDANSGNVDGGASVSVAAGASASFTNDGTNWWTC